MIYRTGRHNGRIIYLQLGVEPADTDPMVGAMDTTELGAQVVEALNYQMTMSPPSGCFCCLAPARHCRHCHAKGHCG